MRQTLHDNVILPFCRGYLDGKTPIPCILCNPAVKFRVLFDIAEREGAQFVATGHYVRTGLSEQGYPSIYSIGHANDQAYMLYRLRREWLSRLIFPLADMQSKDEVRTLAQNNGLSVSQKDDSMEICFEIGRAHV